MKRARRAASGCARETPHVCARPDACASVGEILRAGGGACVRRLRARGRCGGGKRLAHAVHVVAEGEKERKGGCVDVKPVRGSGCGGVEVVDLVSDDECESRCVRGDSHVRRVRDAAGEERADGGGAGCAGGASGVCGGSARVCGGYAAEKCLGVAEGNLRGAERPAHADEIQHCDGAVAHGMPHAKCQRARGRAQAQAAVHDSPTSTSDRDPAQASLAARAGGELRVAGRDDCGRMGTAREDLCARRADLDAIVAVRVRPLVTGAEGMRVRRGANGAHRSLARFDRKRFGGCGDDVREEEEDVGEKDVEEEEDAAVQEVPHVAREEASHPDTSTLQASHPQQQTVAHRDPVGTPERRQSNSTSTGDAHVQMPVEQIVPVNSIHPVEQPRQESISSVNSGIPLGQPFIEQTASVNNVNCGILAQVKLQQTLEQCHAAELPADNAGANEQVAPISSGNAHAYPPVEQSAPAISGHLLEQPHVEHISSVNSAHVPVPPQVEQHSQMPCAQLAAQPFVAQILSPSFDHMTVPSPAMPVSPINALQHHPQTPYEQAMLNHAHLPAHAAQAPEQKPSYISGVPSHQSTYAMSPALTSPNTHTPPSQTAPPILDASHQLFMLDQYKTAASIPVEPCIPTLAPMQNYPTPQSTYLQGGPRMYGGIPAEHAQPRPIGMRVPAPRNAEPPLKRVRRVWSPEEDRLLCELVFMQNRSVSEIVTVMKHRTGSAISQRLAMLKTAMRQDLSEFRERYRERNRECETEKDIAFQVQFGSGVDVPHDVTGGVVRGCDGEEKAKMDDPFVMQF